MHTTGTRFTTVDDVIGGSIRVRWRVACHYAKKYAQIAWQMRFLILQILAALAVLSIAIYVAYLLLGFASERLFGDAEAPYLQGETESGKRAQRGWLDGNRHRASAIAAPKGHDPSVIMYF